MSAFAVGQTVLHRHHRGVPLNRADRSIFLQFGYNIRQLDEQSIRRVVTEARVAEARQGVACDGGSGEFSASDLSFPLVRQIKSGGLCKENQS